MKNEISRFIRERFALGKTSITLSVPTLISILAAVSQRFDILWMVIYIFIIYLVGWNSFYLLTARDQLSATEMARRRLKEGYEKRFPILAKYAWFGIALSVLLIPVFGFVPPFKQPVNVFFHGTATPSPTITPMPSPSSTVTPTPSPKPVSDSLYYMIVYDSSVNMDESFHGEKKWQVARNLLVEIMNGLNANARYNMAVIGGSTSTDGADPCSSPASLSLTSFSSRNKAHEYLGNLQPQGGGSFYKAYTLAKNQFQDLPADTIKTLIYITGSSDTCETEDEWGAIKNLMSISDSTFNIFSQIIILDDDGIRSRTLAEQFESLANENVNVQAPQSLTEIQSNGVTLVHIVSNITTYETNVIASLPTNTPTVTSIPTITNTPTITATLKPGETRTAAPTNTPTSTFTYTPTFTPTFTRTSTPTKTFTPSYTPSLPPVCLTISPYIDTASFSGSAWINTPAHCTTNITSGEPIPASGGYAALPPGTILWVFVYPPNGPFYPQSPNACASSPSPYPSQGGGGWSVPVYFGNLGDPSKFFDLVVMVTDQAGSDYIGQRLYEDCSGGFFDGISAGDLASLDITTKATITIKTK